jgi:phosphate transport system substrate-binding protein
MKKNLALPSITRAITSTIALACVLMTTVRAEDITIPGSGNNEFVLSQLANAFNASQNRHKVSVPPSSGTAGALRDLNEGKTAIGRVGRPLKEEERAKGLSYFSLGRDPVVFVGGSGITTKGVTRTQMIDAYMGKITDWRDLGGKPAPIRAVGREETDASRQAISRDIKAFGGMKYFDGVKVVNLDPQLLELLDRYPTSLGFLNRSALNAAKTKLVPLALDGVPPTPDNVDNGRYPIVLDFGLAYKSNGITDAGREFMAFIESPAGIKILRANGVLPPATRN